MPVLSAIRLVDSLLDTTVDRIECHALRHTCRRDPRRASAAKSHEINGNRPCTPYVKYEQDGLISEPEIGESEEDQPRG
jgi:hypothetical protein